MAFQTALLANDAYVSLRNNIPQLKVQWQAALTELQSGGYTGSMVSDANAVSATAQAIIAWIATNFPASGGFIQDRTLNADGSRTARSFSSAQTAGLQTVVASAIATIQ